MKAVVDEDRCRGHGMCLTLCPEVFAIGDGGYAEVLVDEVPLEYAAAVAEAVDCCPEHAIKTVEGE
ncbi:MAG: ferredoxin [Mycobacterium sp.]